MQTHPKWKYHRTEKPRLTVDLEEEMALGDDWHNHPDEVWLEPAPPPLTDAEEDKPDERTLLIAVLESHGMTVDKRWSTERLRGLLVE